MNNVTIDNNFNKALNNFNFKQVHDIMELLDWKWATKRGYEVPTQMDMIESVVRLFKSFDGVGRISSGGFEVEIEEDNVVSIRFIAQESMWMGEFDYPDGKVSENE